MPSKVSVQPSEEPVSVAQAKAWLKVENSVDDDLITALVSAARSAVESYTGQKLISQTIEETFNCFPTATMHNRFAALCLTHGPLRSVTSVEYQASAGIYSTLSTDNYTAHSYQNPPLITAAYEGAWPGVIDYPEAVKITYVVGIAADADGVPELYKNAIKKLVTQWYENRAENMRRMPTDVEWMLNAVRVPTL